MHCQENDIFVNQFLTARAKSSQETSSEKDESAIVTSDSVPAPPGFPQVTTWKQVQNVSARLD